MKYFILFAALILLSLSYTEQQFDKENIIKVDETSISFNQHGSFTIPGSPKDLNKVLGRSTVHAGDINSIYTWDSLGLIGFARNKDSMVYSFEIGFSEFDFTEPPVFYTGKVQIFNHTIDRKTKRKEFINLYRSHITDTSDFMPEFKIGSFTVIAEFGEDSDEIIGLAISE